jgi:hypothetical protein
MSTLLDLTPDAVKPAAKIIADRLLHKLNATLAERVNDHRTFFREFWDSPETPDEILAQMGVYAPVLLAAAGENLEHITRLGAVVGKTLGDFLDAVEYEPRLCRHWHPERIRS